MQNKFEKIVISALVVAVLFLGIMLIFQQKTINQMKSDVSDERDVVANSLKNSVKVDANLPKGNLQNDSQKIFPGEIKAIDGNILEVDAKLVKVDDPVEFQVGKYSTVTKKIRVLLNNKTKYFGKERENIAKESLIVGDKIFVDADQSPFQAESLTASKIYLINAWPPELNQ